MSSSKGRKRASRGTTQAKPARKPSSIILLGGDTTAVLDVPLAWWPHPSSPRHRLAESSKISHASDRRNPISYIFVGSFDQKRCAMLDLVIGSLTIVAKANGVKVILRTWQILAAGGFLLVPLVLPLTESCLSTDEANHHPHQGSLREQLKLIAKSGARYCHQST